MTQRQIAEMLGVSVATVSMALNDSPRVKNETKLKVRQLASDNKYRINELARSLSSGKTRTIGILFPEFDNAFYAHLADAIQRRLVDLGYIGIFISSDSTHDMNKYIDLLVQRNVDGIISKHLNFEDMARLCSELVPSVFYSIRDDGVDSVVVNRARGVCDAMNHLISLGHRKIGFIGHQSDMEQRYVAYRNIIMSRYELVENPAWITDGMSTYETGYNGMRELLSLKKRPTAVFCHCDVVALGALCAAFEQGVKVPDEMSIIGYDNIKESRFAAVPLTTIEVNVEELAKALTETLFKRIKEPDGKEALRVTIEPQLIVRKSSGICPKD